MAKIRGDIHRSLHDLGVSYKNSIELEELKEGEKISIMSDSMFKTMFQNDNRIKYSAKLISYYIDISYEELLKSIRLSKNELDKNKEKSKGEKCDYVATINDATINIEVNNNGSLDILERNIEYAYRLFSKMIKRGGKYAYNQVIQFNINNFSFEGNDKIVDIYSVQNDDLIRCSDKLIFVQIYIPNLMKKWYTLGVQKLDESEKYLLALVLRNIDDSKKVGEGVQIMEEYVDEAVGVSLDDDLRESYDKEIALKDLGRYQGYIDGEAIGREEGLRVGREKGIKEGLEKGIKEGLEEGKKKGLEEGKKKGLEEGKKKGLEEGKIEVAKKLLKENISVDVISKCTGLSNNQIKEL